MPRLSLFAVQTIRTSHVRQEGLQKVKTQMQFLSDSESPQLQSYILSCDPKGKDEETPELTDIKLTCLFSKSE